MMHWFAVFLLAAPAPPHDADGLSVITYPTREACYRHTANVARSLVLTGTHGRYLCMRRGESDRELSRSLHVEF